MQTDAEGTVVTYKIKDSDKKSVGSAMRSRAEDALDRSWAKRWEQVCTALDASLKTQSERLEAENQAVKTFPGAVDPTSQATEEDPAEDAGSDTL